MTCNRREFCVAASAGLAAAIAPAASVDSLAFVRQYLPIDRPLAISLHAKHPDGRLITLTARGRDRGRGIVEFDHAVGLPPGFLWTAVDWAAAE